MTAKTDRVQPHGGCSGNDDNYQIHYNEIKRDYNMYYIPYNTKMICSLPNKWDGGTLGGEIRIK